MPTFQSAQGMTITVGYYPGNSYRALVVNNALNHNTFIIATILGVPTPMYQCCQCRKWHTSAGLEGDHMIARIQGGGDDLGNLATCKYYVLSAIVPIYTTEESALSPAEQEDNMLQEEKIIPRMIPMHFSEMLH